MQPVPIPWLPRSLVWAWQPFQWVAKAVKRELLACGDLCSAAALGPFPLILALKPFWSSTPVREKCPSLQWAMRLWRPFGSFRWSVQLPGSACSMFGYHVNLGRRRFCCSAFQLSMAIFFISNDHLQTNVTTRPHLIFAQPLLKICPTIGQN